MKSKKKLIIVTVVLSLAAASVVGVALYQKDTQTVPRNMDSSMGQEAKVVRAYIVNFCMEYARYPSKEEFDKRYPKLAANPDWSYLPGEGLKSGTFSSGSNTVTNPCKVFTTEVF
jgi:hypothetical protein